MRPSFSLEVENGRFLIGGFATSPGSRLGAFSLRCPITGEFLKVIVSDGSDWQAEQLPGEPWEHVSVSTARRCPTWEEMCWVKGLVFDDEDCVVQFHPPQSKYVNRHPFVLHLWKPPAAVILPPMICV